MQVRAMASGAEFQQPFVRFLRINGNPMQSVIGTSIQCIDSGEDNDFTVSVNPVDGINWWLDELNDDGTMTPTASGTVGTGARIIRFTIPNATMSSGSDYILRVVQVNTGNAAAELEITAM